MPPTCFKWIPSKHENWKKLRCGHLEMSDSLLDLRSFKLTNTTKMGYKM